MQAEGYEDDVSKQGYAEPAPAVQVMGAARWPIAPWNNGAAAKSGWQEADNYDTQAAGCVEVGSEQSYAEHALAVQSAGVTKLPMVTNMGTVAKGGRQQPQEFEQEAERHGMQAEGYGEVETKQCYAEPAPAVTLMLVVTNKGAAAKDGADD